MNAALDPYGLGLVVVSLYCVGKLYKFYLYHKHRDD